MRAEILKYQNTDSLIIADKLIYVCNNSTSYFFLICYRLISISIWFFLFCKIKSDSEKLIIISDQTKSWELCKSIGSFKRNGIEYNVENNKGLKLT